MTLTLTAKIRLLPTEEQIQLLQATSAAYKRGCNFVSKIMYETKLVSQLKLHPLTYIPLRTECGLKSQMAQSALKTTIARYKTLRSNDHNWTLIKFKTPEYDLVYNRDYSLTNEHFSVNTLDGHVRFRTSLNPSKPILTAPGLLALPSWLINTASGFCTYRLVKRCQK